MKLRLSSLSQRFLDDFLIALLSRFGTLGPICLQYVFSFNIFPEEMKDKKLPGIIRKKRGTRKRCCGPFFPVTWDPSIH